MARTILVDDDDGGAMDGTDLCAQILDSMAMVGVALQSQGKYVEAERMIRHVLAGREKVLGRCHPDTLTSVSSLVSVLRDRGKYAEAEGMFRWVLTGTENVLGRGHPDMLTSLSNLGSVLQDQGYYATGERIYWWILTKKRKVLAWNHRDTFVHHEQSGFGSAQSRAVLRVGGDKSVDTGGEGEGAGNKPSRYNEQRG